MIFDNPARIDTSLDSRQISFENPTGARGGGGTTAGGRKGTPNVILAPGEKVVIADVEGPGCIRHIWLTIEPDAPEEMRSVWMEVYYDDLGEPSISVPCLDFFALPHGRPAAFDSALVSAHEGLGFNAYFPMPFSMRVRFEITNSGNTAKKFFFQMDYTLQQVDPEEGYLHVSFRRENPTVLKQDFVVAEGFRGPGRFLGCAVGIRVLQDGMFWYGEGEFKIYRDGDDQFPTICGTGLEDYVGGGWGMNQHVAFYAGVPVSIERPHDKPATEIEKALLGIMPDFVSFYRWHLPDPIIFQTGFKATLQQIGNVSAVGEKADEIRQRLVPAGPGWIGKDELTKTMDAEALAAVPDDFVGGLAERSDDVCATAFVYCRDPQPVPRLDIALALRDIARLPYE